MYSQDRGGGRAGRGHQMGSSAMGSVNGRKAELTSAYASLAAELTRKEIKTVGGYTLGRVIGEGSFGKVYLGIHRLTNTRVAIKQVPKSLPFSTDPSSPLSLLTREIHHHRRLRHPHVLALYEIIATESSIYLITELCTGGELFDYLVEKGRLSLAETRRVFGQLVLGVSHLHRSGVVHRDLKLENVLLDEHVNVKIADLGFGREFEKGRWMETWVGTLGYCAPEVVAAKRYLGEEVDIWSLGVILYTLLTGSLPFDDDDEAIMSEKILKCEYDIPTWLDEDAADLIQGILLLDPLRRMSLKNMLAHPFFTRPLPPPPAKDPRDSSPHPSHSHHPRHHSSHHHHSHATPDHSTHEAFPPAIPEEGSPTSDHQEFLHESPSTPPNPSSLHPDRAASSAPSDSSENQTYHSLTSSDISDSSFFSASSSDLGHPRSGATTPITSEEGDKPTSAVREGKRKAVHQSGGGDPEDLWQVLHRNESETTLRKTGDESSSSSFEGTPRGSLRGRNLLPTSTEEDSTDEGDGRPPLVAVASSTQTVYQSSLGLSAPLLQRNVSESSTGSFGSVGGSPVPVHARTPSRTKRHSVGSMFSERLFSLDEEALPDQIDYLSLLTSPYPAPLSTPGEKDLLDSLTTLGFDTGQIVHSVMTDACDSSGAIWWMLKRKLDAHSRERADAEALAEKEKERERKPDPIPVLDILQVDEAEQSPMPSSDDDSRRDSDDVRPHSRPTVTDPGFFLHQPAEGSMSAPLLPFFPIVEPASPTRQKIPRSKSKDCLSVPSPHTSPVTTPASLPTSVRTSTDSAQTDPSRDGAKSKRNRSGSASMLARATSALGSSLALKKSTDGDAKGEEGGRSTPTLAGMFGRKGSLSDEVALAAATPPASSTPSTRRGSVEPPEAPSTPKRKSTSLATTSPHPSSAISSSASHDTFDTVTSSSTERIPAISNSPAKKGSAKGNLFANFKMWFGDDRRKRNKRGTSSHSNDPSSSRGGPPGSASRRGGRNDLAFVGSPLKRPLASRRSSNGSIIPPSRRSSTNSVNRTRSRDPSGTLFTPVQLRRRSDSSRASTSDLEHSRPPSLRSTSGGVERIAHHSKAGSVSSVGSYRGTPQAKDVYRRPPTTTTVRRLHSGRHSRNRSGGSSITRHSSSSSIGEGPPDDVGEEQKNADPILEEDETGYDGNEDERTTGEREKALKKLSGEYSNYYATSTTLGHAGHSRLSLDSHASSYNGRDSPSVFAAHKVRHVFGAPSQPSSSSIGRKSSHATLRPALRDVFAAMDGESEWVDESDDLGGYGGGLGQSSTRSGFRPESAASTASTASSSLFSSTHNSVASTMPSSHQGEPRDSLEYAGGAGNSIGMFEGRYAGVMAAQVGVVQADAGRPARPSVFRSAAVIEEEEEEEEED